MSTPLSALPRAAFLVFVSLALAMTMARADVTGVVKASAGASGGGSNGDSYRPTISANGRYVAFESLANNLVPDDTNGVNDIFVRDLALGTTERVSVSSSEAQAIGGQSWLAAICADGRFVVFQSRATELVPGGRVGTIDVFVRDRLLGTTERVNLTATGEVPATGSSSLPSVSADGRFVTFRSSSPLVPEDTNGLLDIYLRDRVLGVTERVSIGSDGSQGNLASGFSEISTDGRFVVFDSLASNLVSDDTNADGDVFLRDRVLGTTERVSVDSNENEAVGGKFEPEVSADGRFVTFYAYGAGLVPGDTNEKPDAFLRDRLLGTTERIPVAVDGGEPNGSSTPELSADGRFVSIFSDATNLVPGDTNGRADIFVKDRLLGTTERVSLGPGGTEANGPSDSHAISLDGRYVAFSSSAGNLVPGDTSDSVDDIYAVERSPYTTNLPPTAEAGADREVTTSAIGVDTATVTLDGSNSGDPDGLYPVEGVGQQGSRPVLIYGWYSSAGTYLGPGPTLSRTLPLGVHTFTLRVTDMLLAVSEDQVTVTVVPKVNQPPVARAGADQQVQVPHDGSPVTNTVMVTLSGASSSDPDGDALTYEWRDSGGSVLGTAVTLGRTLTPGTHTFTLRVTDPFGAASEDTVTITVSPEPNASPVAAAGADQQVQVAHDGSPGTNTASVTFSGSGSQDPDGDAITYQWRNPAGVVLGTSATFIRTLAVGTHTFTLVVTDPYGASSSDAVAVTVTAEANASPVANAGSNQQVRVPRDRNPDTQTVEVTFSGAASQDPDGDALTFRWRDQAGTQVSSQATLNRTLTAGSYTYHLTVTDPYGASNQASVSVTVLPELNGSPAAKAGPDREAAPVHDGNPATNTTSVTLSGAGSADPDGDSLRYSWLNGAGVTVAAAVTVTLELPVGSHTFTLRVTDPYGASSEDSLTVTVQPEPNTAPVARAGADQQVTLPHDGSTSAQTISVTLSGTNSTDTEGDALTYQWRTPGGSPIAAGATMTRELPVGAHSFVLRATDPYGAFGEDSVTVTVFAEANTPPVAHAGGNRQVTPLHDGNPATDTARVTLNGTGSSDPDGDTLTFEWRLVGGSVLGTTALLNQVPLGPGVHSVTLRVADPYGAAHEDTISVTVGAEPNAAPVAAAGADQDHQLPSGRSAPTTVQVTLNGAGSSDADGDLLSFEWRDAAGALLADTASVTRTLAPGIYSFRLRVTEAYGAAAEDSVNVVVRRAAPNRPPRAAAGPDRTLALPHDGSAATQSVAVALNGSGSRDPDRDAIQFAWRDSQGTVVGTTAAIQPSLTAGDHTFTLRVTDPFGATGEDQVTVRVSPEPNRAPTAQAGSDQALATGPGGTEAEVTLNGSGSRDPDGDALSYTWAGTGGPVATGVSPSVRLLRGRHRLTLTVSDPYGAAAQDVVWITVGVVDVTGEVSIDAGRPASRGRGTYEVRVKVTNRSDGALPAPTSLVLDGLPDGVTLVNATGSTTAAASPYLTGGAIAPGKALQFILRLSSTSPLTALPGTVRVLAGVGAR